MHTLVQKIEREFGKKNPPELKPGDTIRVFQKIQEGGKERVQAFEGIVLKVQGGRGLSGTYTVRKIATGGVGVEKTFPLHSPTVIKVDRLKTAKVRRANLAYIRERRGKVARVAREKKALKTWEEPEAEVELEEIEAAKAEEAKRKAEAVAALKTAEEEKLKEAIEKHEAVGEPGGTAGKDVSGGEASKNPPD